MTETINVLQGASTKEEKYQSLLPQLEALVTGEPDLVANVANIVAALHQVFGHLWIGVYFVKGNDLVLGPFQGPVACSRIGFGKGVCGYCWQHEKPVVVPDVNAFPGHIACNSESKSEIVLPVFRNGKVFMVLDIDSDQPAHFDAIDLEYLQKVTGIIEKLT